MTPNQPLRRLTPEESAAKKGDLFRLYGEERLPVYGILDNIRSLYNVGSIFRTSDGARVRKLYLTGHTPYPPRKEIDKTALGATLTVPWEYLRDPVDAVRAARHAGAKICVLEQTTHSVPYWETAVTPFPICIVVGNELSGVSPEVLGVADLAIEIPMAGSKNSLNAAVAYGIAVYELARRYRAIS